MTESEMLAALRNRHPDKMGEWALLFQVADRTDPSYIEEKYRDAHGRCSAWTACVLAELLNMVAGVDDDLLARMRAAHDIVFGTGVVEP